MSNILPMSNIKWLAALGVVAASSLLVKCTSHFQMMISDMNNLFYMTKRTDSVKKTFGEVAALDSESWESGPKPEKAVWPVASVCSMCKCIAARLSAKSLCYVTISCVIWNPKIGIICSFSHQLQVAVEVKSVLGKVAICRCLFTFELSS